jgi:hypothetical protein
MAWVLRVKLDRCLLEEKVSTVVKDTNEDKEVLDHHTVKVSDQEQLRRDQQVRTLKAC